MNTLLTILIIFMPIIIIMSLISIMLYFDSLDRKDYIESLKNKTYGKEKTN